MSTISFEEHSQAPTLTFEAIILRRERFENLRDNFIDEIELDRLPPSWGSRHFVKVIRETISGSVSALIALAKLKISQKEVMVGIFGALFPDLVRRIILFVSPDK